MDICDSDNEKVIDLKPELGCEISNTYEVKPEASLSTSNNTEYLMVQDSNIKTEMIKQSVVEPQDAINEMQIKHEVNSDSDIEVDLAYKIIDTFNVCELKTFKQECEKISLHTDTLLPIQRANNKPTSLKVELDTITDLDYEMTSDLNVLGKNVHYDDLSLEDGVNKKPVHSMQSKGM